MPPQRKDKRKDYGKVKASPADQKKLLELQALDTRLMQLEREDRTLPEIDALATLGRELDDIVERFGAAALKLEKAREELVRLESDVALVEAREARDATRLQSTSSVKDVQALEAELESLAARRGELEDKQLVAMETVDTLETDYTALETEQSRLSDAIHETNATRETKSEEIAGRRAVANDERGSLVGEIPGELVALYEKQRERYGIGAALLRRGVSLGSNMRLGESDLDAIRKAAPDDVILCPEGNAILVRTEESGL